jgi:rhodanese-related sulfurtransferase
MAPLWLRLLLVCSTEETKKINLQGLNNTGKGSLLNVRSRKEFMGANVASSANISLAEITDRFKEVKALKQPLILVCAGKGRRSMTKQFINKEGPKCFSASNWLKIIILKPRKYRRPKTLNAQFF